MKNKNKILPKVALVALIITLISALILSSVYAKYVTERDVDPINVRPAAFELIMDTALKNDKIEVNFATDGEPGNPIGYTEAYKNYDFTVKTSTSEVAAEYTLTITFEEKIANLIRAGRADKYADGISCNFEVLQKNASGNYVTVAGNESGASDLVWTYTSVINPNTNPDGTITGEAQYRLKMIVYNNTDMPTTGNTANYVLCTDGINIEVSSKQIQP